MNDVSPLVLDLRPIFARGDSPCGTIDEAAGQVIPGQGFVLLVPFEPVPLYAKLGGQGFTHVSSDEADGTWRIEFTRHSLAPAGTASACGCGCG
jgi:uncharacterized protein (DUF2249 family)